MKASESLPPVRPSCAEAIASHERMIIGIARRVVHEASHDYGVAVCEVADVVQEIHIHLYRRWDRIIAVARDLRAYVALESRTAAWRCVHRMDRQAILPVDMSKWDESHGDE